ncbi:protein kinase-like domain, Concanavalin A-like lectin/glucanase domain protein [Artemisia annua]|uniref:Protein kinase-like domain, Concanavalin A-like lectin/glucanase domain protein n=1 Tax=Artemisia annua TaxID=35608 RepID=A0A2U1Q2K5_ARTAN|nr:protein kinase-like domain, Concanavalin A-like lectin/glucanase domain protein [Artemisia annua]
MSKVGEEYNTGTRPVPNVHLEELSDRFKRLKGINPGVNTPRKSMSSDAASVRDVHTRDLQNPSFEVNLSANVEATNTNENQATDSIALQATGSNEHHQVRLQQVVHPRSSPDQRSAQELPFIMRVKIAIGVVSGLVFLHHKQMIDEVWSLSTDYIRIDKDFNAKISYFDLARLVRRESVSGSGNSGAQCDIRDLGYLLMEMLRGKSMGKKEQINLGKRKHYLSGQISDMSDEMIRKVVDRRIKLSVPLTERSRELLYIIQNCIGQGYSLEQALDDLEQIYSRMTRK